MALSPQQEALIKHPWTESGRVLAGPGTGKTYASVQYLARLAHDAPGLRVGYITFTRVVTADFIAGLADTDLTALRLQTPTTMHGYSLRVLQSLQCTRIPRPLRIPDDWEQSQLIRPDLSRLLIAKQYEEATTSKVAALEAELSASFRSFRDEHLPIAAKEPGLVEAYLEVWEEHRRQYGYTLLSELSYQAAACLAEPGNGDPDIDLLIVDEYQDLNRAEQEVLLELHRKGVAVLAIGDDDQSIYSWRNAAPEGIRDFNVTFDTKKNYSLTVCRRSGKPALDVANELIGLDGLDIDRPARDPLEADADAPVTEFRYLSFPTSSEEAAGVARIAQARINAGVKEKKIAVLVRSDLPLWASALRKEFDDLDIPLAAPGDIDSVLGDPGVRRALALGQLLRNQDDSLAWRALLELEPGIDDSVVDYVYDSDVQGDNFAQRLINLYRRGFEGLQSREELIAMVQRTLDSLETPPGHGGPPDKSGWAAWLAGQVGADAFTAPALEKFLAVGAAVGKRNRNRLLDAFQTTLRELTSRSDNQVRLMTIAMSKGLTFDTTIVMGVEEGNIPDVDGEIAEERRYLYVALTRAKALTVVTCANQRTDHNGRVTQRKPSQFMSALKSTALEDGRAYP